MDVEHYDRERGVVLVLGKGRDEREAVPVSEATQEVLNHYLTKAGLMSGALFLSRSNRGAGNRLTTKSIRRMITAVFATLGIKKSTHGLRHRMATRTIRHFGGDLSTACRYTRHKSITTIQVYNDEITREDDLPEYLKATAEISLLNVRK